MSLTKQPIALRFAGGVETKIDSKQVPATQLLNLENATFVKASTLAKRNGYRALSQLIDTTSASYTDARGLAIRNDEELIVFAADRAYSYRSSIDRWSDTGPVSSLVATDVPLARTGTAQTMPDVATYGGITVAAWEDSRGGVWATILDATAHHIILPAAQLDSSGQRPRCIAAGSVVLVLWANASTGRINVAVANPATPTTLTPMILTDDLLTTNPAYDACPAYDAFGDGIRPGAIAWCTALGYRIGYVHPSGVLGSPGNGLPSVASYATVPSGAIAVAITRTGESSSNYLAAVYVTGGNLVVSASAIGAPAVPIYTASVATVANAARIAAEFGAQGAATAKADLWCAVELAGATTDLNLTKFVGVDSTGTQIGTTATVRGHGLVSRAWYDHGHVYAALGHGVKFFPYVAAVRLSAGLGASTPVAARLLPGQSTGLPARGHVASVPALDLTDAQFTSRRHALPLGVRIQLASDGGDQFGEAGIRLVTIDSADAASWQTAQLNRGLYLASACIQHYDGSRWAEADFHCAPDQATGAATIATAGSGGSMDNGTYGYKLCYEEVDAMGEIHRGAVSVETNVVTSAGAASGKVTLTIPTCRLTAKPNVRIGVFRSPVNQTGDPESIPFYRVSGLDPNVGTGNNRFVANGVAVDTVTFVDVLTDVQLIAREPLYTNGGVLSNDPAPSSGTVLAGGKSRLYWVDPSDHNLVRYSQPILEDAAVASPADLWLRVDPYGGAIVGIGVMDDAVIVLKETAIYAFGGPGPSLDGGLQTPEAFTPVVLVTSDSGCKSPASIASTPEGITFQSTKGIQLITRQRDFLSIGDPVYLYKDQLVTRATLLPDRHQIVFLTSSGRTLLYDYEYRQWSTYTNHEGLDAVVLGGVYHYLRTDGRVFRETVGAYRDDNSQIRMTIETAWIKATGYLQGWQRIIDVLLIGEYRSAHTLRMRYRIDYQAGYSAPIDSSVNANYDPSLFGDDAFGDGAFGGPAGASTVYQRKIHLNKRCQSIAFEFSDVEATADAGASYELSELLLMGGILRPAFKPGAARSA